MALLVKFGILLYLGPEFRLGSLLFLNLNWMDSPISSWNNQRSQASLCADPILVDNLATTKSSNESSTHGPKSERKRGSRVERESDRQRRRVGENKEWEENKRTACAILTGFPYLYSTDLEKWVESPSTTLPSIKVGTLALYGRWEMKKWMCLKEEPSD